MNPIIPATANPPKSPPTIAPIDPGEVPDEGLGTQVVWEHLSHVCATSWQSWFPGQSQDGTAQFSTHPVIACLPKMLVPGPTYYQHQRV